MKSCLGPIELFDHSGILHPIILEKLVNLKNFNFENLKKISFSNLKSFKYYVLYFTMYTVCKFLLTCLSMHMLPITKEAKNKKYLLLVDIIE